MGRSHSRLKMGNHKLFPWLAMHAWCHLLLGSGVDQLIGYLLGESSGEGSLRDHSNNEFKVVKNSVSCTSCGPRPGTRNRHIFVNISNKIGDDLFWKGPKSFHSFRFTRISKQTSKVIWDLNLISPIMIYWLWTSFYWKSPPHIFLNHWQMS